MLRFFRRFPKLAAFGLMLAFAQGLAAETVTLTRADGNSLAARLAGDWSRCRPTLILSPGLGGDERSLGWADRAAVGAGYRLLVMEHRESGPSQLFGIRRRADPEAEVLRSPTVWAGRAADLDAAIAYARQDGCRPQPFLLGGHSMGAALTMVEAGAEGRIPYEGGDRFDAYIAISPQGPGWAFASASAWSGVSAPVLMLTGTRDDMLGAPWEDRLIAFQGLPPGQKRLAIIPEATHLNLGGVGNRKVQGLAADVVQEFLLHVIGPWGPSPLDGSGGLEVRDK
jgi:pimeloyl-ACP methyl ester carboxylesterase